MRMLGVCVCLLPNPSLSIRELRERLVVKSIKMQTKIMFTNLSQQIQILLLINFGIKFRMQIVIFV
jgi:hypothetical protein